jgi:hypothetical protein
VQVPDGQEGRAPGTAESNVVPIDRGRRRARTEDGEQFAAIADAVSTWADDARALADTLDGTTDADRGTLTLSDQLSILWSSLDAVAQRRVRLSDERQDLLRLASLLEHVATSARSIALTADREDEIPGAVAKLRRMRLAAAGLREEDGPQYHDARMLLTATILDQARQLRLCPENSLEFAATLVAARVQGQYPSLATCPGAREPRAAIAKAIEACAASPRRVPWRAIVDAWVGVEVGEHDPETWRVSWDRYRRRRKQRLP